MVRLNPDETGGSLFDRLSLLGGDLILSDLKQAEKGEIHPAAAGSRPGNLCKENFQIHG